MRLHRCFWALATALLASCYSYGAPDEVVFGEAVYTQQSPGTDFKPLSRYFLDPTVTVMNDGIPSTGTLPDGVISNIDAHMAALGYTKVDSLVAAAGAGGVGVRAAVLKGTGAVYYPGYWCDYWTYYGCYYSWYYAGSYKFGTLILEMGDLSGYPPPQNGSEIKLPILWTSAMYGVQTTAAYDIARVNNAIDRAFAQSPYLDTK
jgi:hypothetical protein